MVCRLEWFDMKLIVKIKKKLDAVELLKKTQEAWSNVSDKEPIIGIAKYTVRYLTILFISL